MESNHPVLPGSADRVPRRHGLLMHATAEIQGHLPFMVFSPKVLSPSARNSLERPEDGIPISFRFDVGYTPAVVSPSFRSLPLSFGVALV